MAVLVAHSRRDSAGAREFTKFADFAERAFPSPLPVRTGAPIARCFAVDWKTLGSSSALIAA